MADVNISKYTTQVVRGGSKPASPGFVVSEGQNPVDPAGSGQNHLPVTIGSPANGLAITEAQILTIDKAQIFAGTSSQFVKGDGTLDSNTYLTTGSAEATYVPYTGATADVNLGTHDLTAERGTFENNGSSDTLTVNHTSGSGYGIIVTKGGNNEALYVSKTSGSGNAMTVVGGRTSLVDLALSSVTNTAGDFLTLSGGVVHKRTAAEVLTDIGGQAALTNPVTGTGTTNYLPKFTGASTIGNSQIFDNGTNVGIGTTAPVSLLNLYGDTNLIQLQNSTTGNTGADGTRINLSGADLQIINRESANMIFYTSDTERMRITSGGNLLVGTTTDAGYKLDVNGTGRFSGALTGTSATFSTDLTLTNSSFSLLRFINTTAANTWNMYAFSDGSFNLGVSGVGNFLALASTGAATFSSSVTAAGNAATNPSFIANNPSGSSGTAQHYIDFTAGATVIGRILRGNGASNLVANGLNIDNFDGCQIRLNQLGGSGGSFNVLGGNVLIGTTTDNGAKLQINGITSSAGYRQDTGAVTLGNNSATTIYSNSGIRGLYLVYVSLPAGDGAAANYTAYAIIAFDTSASRIMQQTDGLNLFITLSGNNVQARQTSGGVQSIEFRIIKIV